MQGYRGQSWLDAPWLVTEFYFYRRVAQVFGYFRVGREGAPTSQPDSHQHWRAGRETHAPDCWCCGGQTGYDPFSLQKRLGLEGSASLTRDLAGRTEDISESAARYHHHNGHKVTRKAQELMVWLALLLLG